MNVVSLHSVFYAVKTSHIKDTALGGEPATDLFIDL